MGPKAERLLAEALQLPEKDRLRLAEELYESVEDADGSELSPAWREEIARRLKKLGDPSTVLIDGDEQERRLREKYAL